MTDISITIVAYNNEEDVRNAVCSIMEHTAITISKRIYIVDNSTGENNLAALERENSEVTYLRTEKNLGFGAGHNYVLPWLDSRYHAIVNPDIILREDSFKILMDFMERENIGMAVPKMTDEQGDFQAVYRRELTVWDMGVRMFLSSHFKKRQAYHTMQDMDYSRPFQVPFAQGSFLVIRTELFRKLGGFDDRYFMYMEDADLCRQVNQCSSLWYCPDTTVIHKWERASHKGGKLRRIHMASMFKYFLQVGVEAVVGDVRISVAMVTYNGEKYIKEQIDSIMMQLTEQDELVISDDGSADGTRQIIEEYRQKDKRIKVVEGPKQGIKKNVECALKHCQGKIIFLADQDDIWKPDKVEKVLAVMEQENATLVIHDAEVFQENPQKISMDSFFAFRKAKAGVIKNIIKNSYIGCCMAFRRELSERAVPIPADIEMHDQWIGVLNDFYYKKSVFLEEPLLLYRRHGENNSAMEHYGIGRMISNRARFIMYFLEKFYIFTRNR